MGLSPETRFGFRYTVRLQACLWKALRMQESAIVWGSSSFWKVGGKAEALQGQCQELEAGDRSGVFVSFVSPGVLTAEGETHMDMTSLMIYNTVSAS